MENSAQAYLYYLSGLLTGGQWRQIILATIMVFLDVTPYNMGTGPEDSRKLRLPVFMTVGTWKGQFCQSYAPAAYTPRKYSWYSFLLEAESTPGPKCGLKDTSGNRTHDLPICSAVPQPTALPRAPRKHLYLRKIKWKEYGEWLYTMWSIIDRAKRFEVLTVVLLRNKVFCNVTLCFFG